MPQLCIQKKPEIGYCLKSRCRSSSSDGHGNPGLDYILDMEIVSTKTTIPANSSVGQFCHCQPCIFTVTTRDLSFQLVQFKMCDPCLPLLQHRIIALIKNWFSLFSMVSWMLLRCLIVSPFIDAAFSLASCSSYHFITFIRVAWLQVTSEICSPKCASWFFNKPSNAYFLNDS